MKIVWHVEPRDIEKTQRFFELHQDDPFVQERIQRNLSENKPAVSRGYFWYVLVSCLLTTQQRSGPNSPVTRFINTRPFPLSYELCLSQGDVRAFAREVISDARGIRFSNRLSDQIAVNLDSMERGFWDKTSAVLEELRSTQTLQNERKAANFIDRHLKGFGPKQSRNLLQWIGLTRYEIPIDSRITKWLNDLGFPVRLSAAALSDRNYYNFVSEGIQQLCVQAGLYPCVLDAVIFVSFDKGGWSKADIIW